MHDSVAVIRIWQTRRRLHWQHLWRVALVNSFFKDGVVQTRNKLVTHSWSKPRDQMFIRWKFLKITFDSAKNTACVEIRLIYFSRVQSTTVTRCLFSAIRRLIACMTPVTSEQCDKQLGAGESVGRIAMNGVLCVHARFNMQSAALGTWLFHLTLTDWLAAASISTLDFQVKTVQFCSVQFCSACSLSWKSFWKVLLNAVLLRLCSSNGSSSSSKTDDGLTDGRYKSS